MAVTEKLVDPMKNLRNWKKGDPCTFNWTGVICSDNLGSDGYFHVQELYAFSYQSFHSPHLLVIGLLLFFSALFILLIINKAWTCTVVVANCLM